MRSWWNKSPNASIGIITGGILGIVVLDADSPSALKFLKDKFKTHETPLTPIAATPNGRHIFFKHPRDRVRNKVNSDLGLDVRDDGGYIIISPSIHPSGEKYKWKRDPWELKPIELPSWAKDYMTGGCKGKRVVGSGENQPGWVRTVLANGVRDPVESGSPFT